MEKALVVKASGETQVVTFEVGESYEVLRSAVDGWIECVRIGSLGIDLWVNEEGKIHGLPINFGVSYLYWDEYKMPILDRFADPIVGDVIFTTSNDEGETTGLSDEQMKYLQQYFAQAPSPA